VGVTLSGANRHDIKLLETALQSIVVAHQEGVNVCLDAGYVCAQKTVEGMGYEAHIRSRGEEKEKNSAFKARRWVVEVCCSWLNRFRKLLVRYEKKAWNYLALVEFACTIIIWHNLRPCKLFCVNGKS
jgi:transposase